MIRRLTIGCLLLIAFAGWLIYGIDAVATGSPHRVSADRPCAQIAGTARQSGRGVVSGCLEVGSLAAGPHIVVAEQYLDLDPLAALRRKYRLLEKADPRLAQKLLAALRTPVEPAVTLTLSPSSGPPGTPVTVTGHVSAPVRRSASYLQFCWDGCVTGLQFDGNSAVVRWISRTTFHARLTVPDAPWIEGDPTRAIPLSAGSYPIGVQCVISKTGCGLAAPEGTAGFTLRSSGPPSWCPTSSRCGELTVTPTSAAPGASVGVTGHLPLASVDASEQPLSYELAIVRGSTRGPELRFHGTNGLIEVIAGHARLRVLAPPSFASLGNRIAPLTQSTGGLAPIAADPTDPSTVAWCANGSIGVVRSGVTSTVSTRAVASVLSSMGFETLSGGTGPSCTAIAPTGDAIVAAFGVGLKRYGAPPVYEVALQSTDDGVSWTPVPVPPGASASGFGGFRYDGGTLTAVYAASEPSLAGGPPVLEVDRPLAQSTSDGALTWTAGTLGCPAVGPCITLSPISVGDCAMGLSSQSLLRSTDGGVRWTPVSVPGGLQPCGDVELTSLAGGDELLVNSLSPFVLVRSTDGGVSWGDISLPRVPDTGSVGPLPGPEGAGFGPAGVVVTPDGGLLLSGELSHWELLAPGATRWCRVPSVPAALQSAEQLSPITVIGDQFWWLAATNVRNVTPVVHEVAAASVDC